MATGSPEYVLWGHGYWRTYRVGNGEGPWDAANGVYGGGMQLDRGFQRTYGSEFLARYGPAGQWPIWAQLLAAYRAYHGYHGYPGRGFSPWPNTARDCGLL